MIDRIPVPPVAAPAVRLHSWYGSVSTLLRELSRALNKGQTILRAESGLPVGTHLVLVMEADCLTGPIEVQGTVTASRVRGTRHLMTLRYDFDPGPHGARLAEAMAELRRQTRRPRRTPRVPLELATESAALPRGVSVSVVELSRDGARLRVVGPRLPRIDDGTRFVLAIGGGAGRRGPQRLAVEVRWAGPARGRGRRRSREIGGRLVGITPALRRALTSILRFEEARPRLALTEIVRPRRPPRARARSRSSRRAKSR